MAFEKSLYFVKQLAIISSLNFSTNLKYGFSFITVLELVLQQLSIKIKIF